MNYKTQDMKTYHVLTLAILLQVSSALMAQNIKRVDGNVANGAPYTTIQAAVDAAVAGDTIHIVGAASAYAGATVTKQLVIIGPGYFLSENPQTQMNKSTARLTGVISLKTGSAGSTVMGLYFDLTGTCLDLDGGLSNIVIKRNYFRGTSAIRFNVTNGIMNNITVQQNYFLSAPWTYSFSNTNNNIFLLNNYIGGDVIGLNSSSLTIKNNVFNTTGNFAFNATYAVSNSTIQNNIIRISGASPVANVNGTNNFTNNISNTSVFGTAYSNQASVAMSTVFEVDPATVSPTPFTTDSRWQLKSGSPAIGAGASLEDCGMYGGSDPYVLSGLPPIPAIWEMTAPTTATQVGGLNVTIKAKAHQ
jgi:hypothetical protein